MPIELASEPVEGGSTDALDLESVFFRLPTILADLDRGRLVTGLTEIAIELTGAQFGIYCGADSDDEDLLVGLPNTAFADAPSPRRAPLLAPSINDGQRLRVDDVSQWALSEESARPYGAFSDGRLVRSYLADVLRSRDGRLMGALFLGHQQPRAFDRRTEQLLSGICDHLAVALATARMFDERTQVARALQETLLPPILPTVPGADLAARYRATGAGNLVGGDFYDVFELKAEQWAVVLGDVSGFGPEAAALTGVARYTVRAVAPQQAPVDVLRILNSELCRRRDDERFCTAVYARLHPSERGLELSVASGGHPPALILRNDGSVERLDRIKGSALGLFPDAQLAGGDVLLQAGDALVFYTDGVIEARSEAGAQFGLARLEQVLGSCAGRTADGIARRIDLAALDFSEGQTSDDVAVVVVRSAPV